MKRLAVFLLLLSVFAVSCKKDAVNITTPDAPANTISGSTTLATTVTTSTVPAGLPKRVAFGAEGDISQSTQFINEAEYQYVYLAGDIFSNSGWAQWQAPTGQYARNFLSKVGSMGKIPVFTYYNLVPAKGRYEDPAFTNLNDAEVMNKYFNDWKLLLQICKEYGKTVVIHYEPDMFGYFELYKNDASKQTVKVAASNQADVQGFSNNAQGLAQAIVNMRNKYAPNVLLAWHASQWASGMGLITNYPDPVQDGTAIANYYKSLNANFDLIFSDFSDRDEGYYQVVKNQNTVWSTTATAANGYISDFDRYQRFLSTINQQTGKKIMLWQVPVGNTLTQTCNNSSGHYKDNRAEYFLQPVLQSASTAKISQYGQAGVIGFLFGWGINGCTTYMDSNKDGVTGANETADDDGGFLRKSIKAYYQHGAVAL
jgi:hypothetical protein